MTATEWVITGMGMVCSAGNDSRSSFAAVRAGISMFKISERVQVEASSDGLEREGVAIALCPWLKGEDRDDQSALALLTLAIGECLHTAQWTSSLGPGTQVFADCHIPGGLAHPQQLKAALHNDFPELVAYSFAPTPTPFLERLIASVTQLNAYGVERGLIACVDSPASMPQLGALADQGQLKCATNPEGLIPGEAAVALLLESASSASARGVRPLAQIKAWASAREPHPWTERESSKAEGLTTALRECLKMLPAKGSEVVGAWVDLNGQRQRALEWGMASMRVLPSEGERSLCHPADCIGDCGAATGGCLTVLATASLAKAGGDLLIVTSALEGGRAAIVLGAG